MHNEMIRVYDDAGNVIKTHEHNAISKNHSAFSEHHHIYWDERSFPVCGRREN